jgi:hypothetical protein
MAHGRFTKKHRRTVRPREMWTREKYEHVRILKKVRWGWVLA